jgi:hypothetical protein
VWRKQNTLASIGCQLAYNLKVTTGVATIAEKSSLISEERKRDRVWLIFPIFFSYPSTNWIVDIMRLISNCDSLKL